MLLDTPSWEYLVFTKAFQTFFLVIFSCPYSLSNDLNSRRKMKNWPPNINLFSGHKTNISFNFKEHKVELLFLSLTTSKHDKYEQGNE